MSKWYDWLRRHATYQAILHVVVLGLTLEVFVLAKQNREMKSIATSRAEPEIKIGDRVSLSELIPLTTSRAIDSNKTNLLFFFTTTCQFCEKNIAAWKEVNKAASKTPVPVLAICLDGQEKALAYASKFHLTYDIYVPPDPAKYRRQNHIVGVPNTILRSASGHADWVWLGLLDGVKVREIVSAISDIPQLSLNDRREK